MQSSINTRFYAGTSGIVIPFSRELYPDDFKENSRLTYYASLFNSIEINSSFYKLPKGSTVIKWCETVPKDFRFTFKLWKSISHAKDFDFNAEDVALFMQTVNNVDRKKGCILVQLPPSLKSAKIKQLENLFKIIDAANTHREWKVVVEFRNKGWYNDRTYKLLREYSNNLVLHDLPASATPLTEPLTDVIYLRFHGTEKGYRGSYEDKFLRAYAQRIRQWISEGKYVYCYFNNTLGNAFNNLQALNRFVLV